MKTVFYKSLTAKAKQLGRYTRKVDNSFDPGTVHDLRSTFKKLRALLRWQRAGKKAYKCFKTTYDKAGDIRNIQVAQEMLKKENYIDAGFNDWLSAMLERLKKEWVVSI